MSDKFPPKAVANLILSLGNSGFSDILLKTLEPICRPDHLSLLHFHPEGEITYICSANTPDHPISPAQQQLYLSTYSQYDPNKSLVSSIKDEEEVLVKRLKPDEIGNGGYRQLWYREIGIMDRVSIISAADKGAYCLNLFRIEQEFSDDELDDITHLRDLLSGLMIKHSRLAGSLSNFMTREVQINHLVERLKLINAQLTPRETEVSARILLGMSSEGIALDLGIKRESVHTYRKRAYARMNISSQNELFALCLTSK